MKAETAKEIKERPILFSGPMVKAILDGRKTQTRRVVKLPERLIALSEKPVDIDMCANVSGHWSAYDRGNNPSKAWEMIKSPYGKPGDRLWVRETFYPSSDKVLPQWAYRADFDPNYHFHQVKFKPSIFMPREASRITLEITNVRVERLQDISEADAEAEGVEPLTFPSSRIPGATATACTAAENYAFLWNQINGKKHPWESNPWVWVIEFKRIKSLPAHAL